jgi:putative exosortase-associated protein (TIGR04073 family)
MELKVIFSAALLLCALGGALSSGAWAETYRTIENSSPQEIVGGMGFKMARGVTNTATGWLEFPKQIYTTCNEDGAATGIFVGPLKGLGMTFVRTVSGVAEFLTFFSAYPGFYDPYFEPAFVWQKE